MPYGGAPYGQAPGYPYTPPKKSKKPLIIGLSVLGVVLVLGIAVVIGAVVLLKDKRIATDVAVGDCLKDLPENTTVITLDTIDCAEPHGGEVYAVLEMPEGAYPGQAKIDEYQNRCPDELADFSPDAMTDDEVGIYVLYPTPQTWEAGDRAVTCIATLEPKRAGSLQQ